MLQKNELKQNLENYIPYNEQEEVDKRIMLKYIEDFDDVLTRDNEYGHFTSAAFILNKQRTKILMIYHNIYKEAKEETGLKSVIPILDNIYSLEILTVNGHFKRGKYVGSHVHLNITYLLEADEKEEIRIKEDENSGVKWISIDEVVNASSEKWIKENIYSKVIEKMKKDGIIK